MFLSFLFCEPIAKNIEYVAALGRPKVKLFKGPSDKYPLLYILTQRYYPIRVIGEFDHWCRVICPDGEKGWIKKCHLSTKYKCSIVLKDCFLYTASKEDAGIYAKLHKNVFLKVKKTQDGWSYVVVSSYLKGWVQNKNIW